LRAATRSGAITLGLHPALGTLVAGKLADFLVYPPGVNLLEDVTAAREIKFVARGGRMWNASSLVEEWPAKGRSFMMPPFNAD